MNKDKFIELLNRAKVDENGNLYVIEDIWKGIVDVENEDTHRVYFGTITTKCDDLIKEFASEVKNGFELYDRHFWNDDTLECKIVNIKNVEEEYDESKI